MRRAVHHDQLGARHPVGHGGRIDDWGEVVVAAHDHHGRHADAREIGCAVGPVRAGALRGRRAERVGGPHHREHVLGHGSGRGRRDHPVEHLDGVGVHALVHQPRRLGQPGRARLRGLARGGGVGEEQPRHPLRVPGVQVERDLAAHREPGDDRRGHAQRVEQVDEVVGERRPGRRGAGARAVTAQVGHDDAAPRREPRELRSPHGPVERVSVHEQQRDACVRACVVEGEGGAVRRDRVHRRSSRLPI